MPKVIPEYREEARKKIIQSAIEVMARKGYAGTTLEDIASDVGVSKGTLYLYFKNKEALIKDIITSVHSDLHAYAERFHPGKNPLELYMGFLDGLLNRSPERMAFMLEIRALSVRNPEINQIFLDLTDDAITKMTHCFEFQKKNGIISSSVDPRTLAFTMLSVLIGLGNTSLQGRDKDEIRERFREICINLFGMKTPVLEKSSNT